jgi:hypothetical protein
MNLWSKGTLRRRHAEASVGSKSRSGGWKVDELEAEMISLSYASTEAVAAPVPALPWAVPRIRISESWIQAGRRTTTVNDGVVCSQGWTAEVAPAHARGVAAAWPSRG